MVADAAGAEPALVESETDFAAAATAEVLGSASKMTVALKEASLPEHPPAPDPELEEAPSCPRTSSAA